MKIAVVGTGYVGLVTGTCFAETGNNVTCVDIDANKVKMLTNGEITIYEPGLEKLFLRNLKEGRLSFTTDLAAGIKDAAISLPGPAHTSGRRWFCWSEIHIGSSWGSWKDLTEYKLIVDKSTVPVGTAEKVHAAIAKNYKGEFDVVSNPEFLREGVAVEDFMKPDSVYHWNKIRTELRSWWMTSMRHFVRQGNPWYLWMSVPLSFTKYAANSFLAAKISFMNEIAKLCELLGADVDMVRRGIGSDERIGKKIFVFRYRLRWKLFPQRCEGLGQVVDRGKLWVSGFLNAVMEVNEIQKGHLMPGIRSISTMTWRESDFALWGLAFKPNTDDTREAPALSIIETLLKGREPRFVHLTRRNEECKRTNRWCNCLCR